MLFHRLLALVLASAVGPALAAPTGADACDPHILETVAERAWHRAAAEPLDFRAAVCKLPPQHPGVLLVAVAESADDTDAVDLAVAMVDAQTKAVRAVYAWQVFEDADFRVDETSLRLDTADYWLNGDTLAFGLDVKSGYIAHCDEGDRGAARTLFIREADALRPVLSNLTLSSRQFIVVSGRCNWGSKTSITAEFNLTLSFANEMHAGMRDLVVNMRSRRDDGKPAPSKPFRLQVPYDGQRYPKEAIDRAYHAWRVWVEPPKHK